MQQIAGVFERSFGALRQPQDDKLQKRGHPMRLASVIEALLFSAQKPLSTGELRAAIKAAGGEDELAPNEFARVTEAEIAAALEELKIDYIQQQRAFQLAEKADGWQLVSDSQYARWVRELFPAAKPSRLTPPALETLAIIAYRQPIARADVEAVRGVTIEGVLQTLMERGLVKIGGRAEVPGRPLLYETTEFFLEHFGLRNLDELPNSEELRRRYLPTAAPKETTPPNPVASTEQDEDTGESGARQNASADSGAEPPTVSEDGAQQ